MRIDEIDKGESESPIEKAKHETYGMELILDIHDVPHDFFTKKKIRHYLEGLVDAVGMKRGPLYVWGEEKQLGHNYDNPRINGLSAIQFLYESSATIHAIDELHRCFVNLFTCASFDVETAIKYTEENVGGTIVSQHKIKRK